MKLKEKLAKEHGSKKECCCGNSGCGGAAQESAFLEGFDKAYELIADAIRSEIGSDAALRTIGFPFELGEEEVK